MRRSFKYRLYPNRNQVQALAKMLETHRRLYNDALASRKQAWETDQRSVSYGDQSACLKDARKSNPFLAETNFSSTQATLRRLDRSFQAFFRRLTEGDVPGYPRFKGFNRFDTVEFPSYGDGCRLKENRVYIQHVGDVKVKLHRPVEGRIKTVSFKREASNWYAIFSCDLGEIEVAPSTNPPVGIDLGLKSFLVTSEGDSVAPPKFYRQAESALRRAQRRVSRRKRGSRGRREAGRIVARLQQHVANQRRDFHHKTALDLVRDYGTIAVEDLNVQGIARSPLAKSTHDAGWSAFLSILEHKAECAGVRVVTVPPRNTTQACSECGTLPDVPKTLSDRVHSCPHCGYEADRDLNAARNILNVGLDRLGLSRQALTQRVVAYVA
jgi:putative transposase